MFEAFCCLIEFVPGCADVKVDALCGICEGVEVDGIVIWRSMEIQKGAILWVSDFEVVSSGNFFMGLPDRFPFGGISMMKFASEGSI
jgi:hypothetical protein